MIAAKTFQGFPEIRKQFSSDHSLEEGGTEKYYFALVRGEAGDVKIIYIYTNVYIYIETYPNQASFEILENQRA